MLKLTRPHFEMDEVSQSAVVSIETGCKFPMIIQTCQKKKDVMEKLLLLLFVQQES